MKLLLTLLLCLGVVTSRAAPRDPDDGGLVECGAETVAVFAGSVSPDGHYAFGWTIRPARNQTPVSWAGYDPENPYTMLEAYPYDPDKSDPEYRLIDGVLDLHAHRFTPAESTFPYWPNKNHGHLGVAWSHGSRPGKFAVVRNDARLCTWNLWLVETGEAGVRVVDLGEPAEKSVRSFLRRKFPKKYDAMAEAYGDVSFAHGAAMIDFEAQIPKSEDSSSVKGTVHVALPAGTITGVRERPLTQRSDSRSLQAGLPAVPCLL